MTDAADPGDDQRAGATDAGHRPGVGRQAGVGMVVMVGSTVVTRSGALVTQVVLGWLLTDREFGVYAVALSLALGFQILREAGLRDVLVQEGPDQLATSAGPAFWASLGLATVGAVALVAGAPVAARVFDQPSLTAVIVVLAASLPVQSFYIPALARLQVDLRFPTIARIQVVSAIVRYGTTIGLALAGAGALSFAVPVLLVAITEAAMGIRYSRLWAARRPVSLPASLAFLRRSRWPLFNALATALPRQSDYLVLGLVAPTAVVGAYFFAFQLTFQFSTLVYTNARQVLLASFSKRSDDDGWLSDALVRSSAAMSIAVSGTLLALWPLADDVEALLWGGRWAAAVSAISVFTVLLPLSLVLLLPDVALQATGRFRLSFLTSLAGNLGIPVVALLAGRQVGEVGEVWKVALAVGGYTVLSSLLQTTIALRALRVQAGAFLVAGLAPVAIGLGLGAVLSQVHLSLAPILRVGLLGSVYAVAFGVLVRVLLRSQLDAAVRTFGTGRATVLARRALRLPG